MKEKERKKEREGKTVMKTIDRDGAVEQQQTEQRLSVCLFVSWFDSK